MNTTGKEFETVMVPVNELEIDPVVQREIHDRKKVERIVKNFNPAALGIITVSERNQVTKIVLDGWHRWEAVRRLTDNTGSILAHVFKELTLAEEAQMFLDLNAGNQPSVMDKFRARLITGDTTAVEMDKMTRYYGWKIQNAPGGGSIQCVTTLERIYKRSQAGEMDPNVLQLVVIVITKAWGNDKHAASSVILDGLAFLLQEHGSRIDMGRLIEQLKDYPGGPHGLMKDAQQIGSLRRMRTPMAVAEQITGEYNRGLHLDGPNALPAWRKFR